ncbi:MAG: 2-oxoacid:ferredoxin oxidoreductase subunit beta [Chloroflexi bacterium]|nr:2-oxoacid:ferredoxin oxidoreductase subunit beta [Chloroflexota bacterium]MDA0241921.1 2-oxoacid:ferredoxin oxidoreductase subunit beta [Chloroflexota bacterium]
MAVRRNTNEIGLTKADYNGGPTTLCQGCGHNSISSQIITACYDLNIQPWEIIKLSGIGCSSKSPAYFLGQSHGFNALHGRMPAVATGALLANHQLKALAVSGDGDTGSIGMGQFKHLMRRNVDMVYIVENNGVYGLTKGQFSATADEGQFLKYAGHNELPPIDLCMEAIVAGAGFVARSFSGDAKQVRELLKAALSYEGTALIDIISPCVTFNNDESSTKSYPYGKDNEIPLHDISFVPKLEEISVGDYEPGTTVNVAMHDGSLIQLHKLEEDYDPTDRMGAMHRLQWAQEKREFITGLIYYNEKRKTLAQVEKLGTTALAHLPSAKIRPSAEALAGIMAELL